MTQIELDKFLIVEGVPIFHDKDDPILIEDNKGRGWSVGWSEGKRCKQATT